MTHLRKEHLGAFHGVEISDGSTPSTSGNEDPKPKHRDRLELIDTEKMSKREGLSKDEIESAFLHYKEFKSAITPKSAEKIICQARKLSILSRVECYRAHILKLEEGDRSRLLFIRMLAVLMYSRGEDLQKLSIGKLCTMANVKYTGQEGEQEEEKRARAIQIIQAARTKFFGE